MIIEDIRFELLRNIILAGNSSINQLESLTGLNSDELQREIQGLAGQQLVYVDGETIKASESGCEKFEKEIDERYEEAVKMQSVQRWAMRFKTTRDMFNQAFDQLDSLDPDDVKFDLALSKLETMIPRLQKALGEISTVITHFSIYKNKIENIMEEYDDSEEEEFLLSEERESIKAIWKRVEKEVYLLFSN